MEKTIRVAVYARVSTEHEAQISALENQIDWYNSIIEKHTEWQLVANYIDKGITGTSAEKRPHFIEMLEDAKNGEFDLILTREVSRFARNTVDALELTRELKRNRVGVFFINDNINTLDSDGELRLTIMASLAQDESRKISSRVKSGQMTSMKKGVFYGNGNILGYDRKGKELVINPEQAETVKMIYDLYLSGYGIKKIKFELEKRGRKTATGKLNWDESNISRVLQNPFYCGIIEYRKQYVPDFLEQKKVNNYGEVEKIRVEGTHTPIISKEDFDTVQRRLASKRLECPNLKTGKKERGKKPPESVWAKLLICECGHQFQRKVWHKTAQGKKYGYQCYSQVSSGSVNERLKKGLSVEGVCNAKMFPEWKLQMMAKYIFKNYFSDVSRIIEIATEILNRHIGDKDMTADNTVAIEELRLRIEKSNKRLSNLTDMRLDGEISKEMFKEKKESIESELRELNAKLSELLPEKTEKAEEISYEEKIRILKDALDKYTDFDSDDEISETVIEAFVEKIVVHSDSFDWHLRYFGESCIVECSINGRRQNAEIVENSTKKVPTLVGGNTGCNQGLREF